MEGWHAFALRETLERHVYISRCAVLYGLCGGRKKETLLVHHCCFPSCKFTQVPSGAPRRCAVLLDSTLLACSSTSQSTHASRVGGGCARTTVACVLEGDGPASHRRIGCLSAVEHQSVLPRGHHANTGGAEAAGLIATCSAQLAEADGRQRAGEQEMVQGRAIDSPTQHPSGRMRRRRRRSERGLRPVRTESEVGLSSRHDTPRSVNTFSASAYEAHDPHTVRERGNR